MSARVDGMDVAENASPRSISRRLEAALAYGQSLYSRYLDSGKIKFDAKLLRDNNERVRDLSLELAAVVGPELQEHALALAYHADVFVLEWDVYDFENSVSWDEPFAYVTKVGFPADRVNALMTAADLAGS